MSGACTSAGAQVSMSTPCSASTARRSRSAALACACATRWVAPCGGGASRCSGGILARSGCKAAASAPRATASRRRSAAPGGASLTISASAKGTSAKLASAGSATHSWREHRQSLKHISGDKRSCAKWKSCGQEKPRTHLALPPTTCGRSTARRQSPLSAMLSTASDSIGAECFPGSFGSKLKNCISRAAVAIDWALSSSSSAAASSRSSSICMGGGLVTQDAPRLRALVAAAEFATPTALVVEAASSPSSSASAKPCCLKASTSIQPRAHCTSNTGSRRCSSKNTWPRPKNQLQRDSTTMCRDGNGTAARACAALTISSRSKAPRLPCTSAQSANVRAAIAARARL
mmetsp:Transcript_62067/g.173303  ORF Transcript_62067/g.173303 Transcript_62067/m.173303 type:complete len:347 (+) Transcript_62067:270-1310(+)